MRAVWRGALVAVLCCGMASPAAAQVGLATWQASAEQLLSALKVGTKQIGTSKSTTGVTEVKAQEALASSLTSQKLNDAEQKARSKLGQDTGQGWGVCASKYPMQSYATAETSSAKVAKALGEADETWLKSGGDAALRAADLQDARRTFYCTAEERQNLSWCKGTGAGGIPAGDTNAAAFMLRRDAGPEEALTAADYIDTLAPLPTVPAQARNAEEAVHQLEARRKGALLSAARSGMFSVVAGVVGGDTEN